MAVSALPVSGRVLGIVGGASARVVLVLVVSGAMVVAGIGAATAVVVVAGATVVSGGVVVVGAAVVVVVVGATVVVVVVGATVVLLVVVVAPTPLSSPDTAVGVFLWVVVLSPRCPYVLSPQHLTAPVARSAHVCHRPAVMAVTPLESPVTGVGVSRLVVVLSPSCPYPL
jgi:hypothetical protein